jgi:protein tyrosine phosphatase
LIILRVDSPLNSNQRDTNQLTILLEFFRRFSSISNNSNEYSSSPIIVHCSAGIGRSGATIAIDILRRRIDVEGINSDIDMPSLVQYIRSQRAGTISCHRRTYVYEHVSIVLGLVQTERQYELIYRLIDYYVEQLKYLSVVNDRQ